jgi:hypothetical protein
MSITKTVFTDNEARMGDPNTEKIQSQIIGGRFGNDLRRPNPGTTAVAAAMSPANDESAP